MRIAILLLAGAFPGQADLQEARETLERLLLRNILPFWHPQVIDHEDGGYRLNHDPQGRWKGKSNKRIVTQARVVWFYSRLARSRFGKEEHREAARHGYRFLRDKLWDGASGGFFWEVDSAGAKATIPEKHLYGQAFGLYALSEYVHATGDASARDLAGRLFRLLEEKAHDSLHGGYRELFPRDWSEPDEKLRGPMGALPPSTKLMNTHLHLMEAVSRYHAVTRDPLARERLLELIRIQSSAVVRMPAAACTDKFGRDWTPLPGYDRISYGHDVENAWLLLEACESAGISPGPLRGTCETLFETSLRFGFDEKQGGFYDSGPFGAPADKRAKIWWTQAEGLVAALRLHKLTKKEKYLSCFLRTLDWVSKRQADMEHGEWHPQIGEDGKASGGKAGPWKGPYHQGRAVIECLELLER